MNLLYSEVRIPKAVQDEFLTDLKSEQQKTERFTFITNFFSKHSSWFIPCNEYGEDLVLIWLTANMHRGEAEVFAQNQYLESTYELIIDEGYARKIARKENFKLHGVLYLIAVLDKKYGFCNYFKSVAHLKYNEGTHFKDAHINMVYENVAI
ncbi:MAG: hypothetical protein AAGC88_00680 [Bacteroidota bacterium]